MVLGSEELIAIPETPVVGIPSVKLNHELPPLVLFQAPPCGVPTYKVFGSVG
jgi:hypothetical protein